MMSDNTVLPIWEQPLKKYPHTYGYNLTEIRECEWGSEQRRSVHVRNFLTSIRLPHIQKKTMTPNEVLKYIYRQVPLWPCRVWSVRSTYIGLRFCGNATKNIEITRNDIGDHMKAYAEEEGLMNTPRRSLIGIMFGSHILLATPLIQCVLSYGLEIQNIYEVKN